MMDSNALRIAALCSDVVKEHILWIEGNDRARSGSNIDQDDAKFTVMSMSELVVTPFKSALDCLYVVCSSLLDLGRVRGIGHPALVRSSITGSATSLWILDDNSLTRRTRALMIAREQCKRELEFAAGLSPDWYGANRDLDPWLIRLKERAEEVVTDGDRLNIGRSTIEKKTSDTEIVRLGGERIPAIALPGHQPSPHLLSEWRLLSGRAHGFHWSARYAVEERPGSDERFVVYDSAIPADRFLGSVRVAMVATRTAMDRYAAAAGIGPIDLRKPWELS
ncbi:hypothetical protein [Mycobacteroides sp. LB1]|uniref:hypothetical protein n=1 Tax=Mycobacteroides sp. LB1 TaxID=2750814 RepID=UPI0015DFF0C8|nr:hypothetical protein [Mycobacteroides sp. LB1]